MIHADAVLAILLKVGAVTAAFIAWGALERIAG